MKGIAPGTRVILTESVDAAGIVAFARGCRGVVTSVVLADITDDGREVFHYNFLADGVVLTINIPESAAIPEDAKTGLVVMLDNARDVRREIEQIFIDCQAWNDHSHARKAGAAPIDADPDGFLRRQADHLDRHIAELEERLAR